VTDWQPLAMNDSYLVAASDGVFEKLSLQDVCDLVWEVQSHGTLRTELSASCLYSLADCIVNTAFEKGSLDNVAAVVVPLGSTIFSEHLLKERCIGEGDIGFTATGLQKFSCGCSGDSLCFETFL
jgi:serine/threonine protein phosphatase PrpC